MSILIYERIGGVNMMEEEEGMNVPRIRCGNCKYEWTPRKSAPKECPNCKVRLEKGHLEIL